MTMNHNAPTAQDVRLGDFAAGAQYAAAETRVGAAEPSHCSDERPCTPCFTDNGPCDEKPAANQCCGQCEQSPAEQAAADLANTMEESTRPGPDPTHYSGIGGTSPFGGPNLLDQVRALCQEIEALPAGVHQSHMSARAGELAFGIQQLQATGEHFWPTPVMEVINQQISEQRAIINDLAMRLHTADALIITLVQKAGGSVTLNLEDADLAVGHQIEHEAADDKSSFTFRAVPVPQQVAQ